MVVKGRLPTKTMKRGSVVDFEVVSAGSVEVGAESGCCASAFAFLRPERGEARFAFFCANWRGESVVEAGSAESVKSTKSCPSAILSSDVLFAWIDSGAGFGCEDNLDLFLELDLSLLSFSFRDPFVLASCAFLDFRSERF